jgi:hypothetical protein
MPILQVVAKVNNNRMFGRMRPTNNLFPNYGRLDELFSLG